MRILIMLLLCVNLSAQVTKKITDLPTTANVGDATLLISTAPTPTDKLYQITGLKIKNYIDVPNYVNDSLNAIRLGGGYYVKNTSGSTSAKLINVVSSTNATLFYLKNDTMCINTKVKASDFTDDLGKYNLTINSTTHEVYAQQLAHAFYGFADSARSLVLSSNATWYHVTNPGKNLFIDFESDYISKNGDTIILGQSAHWEFHYHVVFTGSTGIWFKMRLFNVTKNQVIPIPTAATAEGTNLTSIGNTAYCTNCDSGDKILLQMIAESNTQTITLIDGSVLIKATHGTK